MQFTKDTILYFKRMLGEYHIRKTKLHEELLVSFQSDVIYKIFFQDLKTTLYFV